MRVYNAAGGETFPFEKYLAVIFSALGKTVPVRVVGEACEGLEWHLNCFSDSLIETARARDELGWQPRTGIVGAVAATVRWLERERPNVFSEDPPDLERARVHEQRGRLVAVEPAEPEEPVALGESFPPPRGPGDATLLSTGELSVLVPLARESEALDRAALSGPPRSFARASGAPSELRAIDAALDSTLERSLVCPLEKDGLPAFRISADGYLAVLAACAGVPDERSPAALLLRFHALSRAVLLERGEDALDPYALGIPFVLPTRTGEEALPEGLLERFNGSFEEFARYFHAALDRVALLRWKGALRLERARLDERRERLLADSAHRRGRARGRGHAEPAPSLEVQIAHGPDQPVEPRWVRRADLERKTLVEPALAVLDALMGALGKLEATLAPPGEPSPGSSPPTSRPLLRGATWRSRRPAGGGSSSTSTRSTTRPAARSRRAASGITGPSSSRQAPSSSGSARRTWARTAPSPRSTPSSSSSSRTPTVGSPAPTGFTTRSVLGRPRDLSHHPSGRIARIFRVGKIDDHAAEVLAALRAR